MCDNLTAQDAEQYLEASGVSRRTFAKMGAGAAAMAALPPVANAQDITSSSVLVPTPDGMMDAYFVHPTRGEHAAVILWPDILGLRPAFRQMGERLAQSGFAVLVVNPYYRTVAGEVVSVGASFRDQETRDKVLPLARTLSPTTCVTDGNALVEFLDAQSAVDNSKKIGTAGYCMTGSYVIRLAAAIPNRIGAGASFHGGRPGH